jgi:hypothetical protein
MAAMRREWPVEDLPTALTVVSPVISTISALRGTSKKSSAESFGGWFFFGKRRCIENTGENVTRSQVQEV